VRDGAYLIYIYMHSTKQDTYVEITYMCVDYVRHDDSETKTEAH